MKKVSKELDKHHWDLLSTVFEIQYLLAYLKLFKILYLKDRNASLFSTYIPT